MEADQDRKPRQVKSYGLSEQVNDTEKKTAHPVGRIPPRATAGAATEKTSGAEPALAEHSKDAKTLKAGRQPSASVKKMTER